MKAKVRQGSAWFVWILTVALAVATLTFAFLNGRHFGGQHLPALEDSFLAIASLGFATVGALIASRRSNVVGWLLSLIGLGLAAFPFTEEYTIRGLVTRPGSVPAVQW